MGLGSSRIRGEHNEVQDNDVPENPAALNDQNRQRRHLNVDVNLRTNETGIRCFMKFWLSCSRVLTQSRSFSS